MIDTLVTFVFYIITSVYSLLFAPFISLIFNLFPSLTTYFIYINNFISLCTSYLSSVSFLMLLPIGALLMLLDYFSIKYSIYLIKIVIKLGVKIYHIFKP